jgi:hypothetical protein
MFWCRPSFGLARETAGLQPFASSAFHAGSASLASIIIHETKIQWGQKRIRSSTWTGARARSTEGTRPEVRSSDHLRARATALSNGRSTRRGLGVALEHHAHLDTSPPHLHWDESVRARWSGFLRSPVGYERQLERYRRGQLLPVRLVSASVKCGCYEGFWRFARSQVTP